MENDKKWINLSYVVAALILSWVVNQFLVLIIGYLRWPNPVFLEVFSSTGLISLFVVSTFAFLYTRQAKVQNYCLEICQELRKVVWPGRKVAYLSTVVVVVCVIFMAVVLGFFDWICGTLVNFIVHA